MADAETMSAGCRSPTCRPPIAAAASPGCRVKLMNELGLAEGDVIEIVGKRSTAARAIRPYGDDEGLDIIRLDGLQRANAGVGSGDFVEVRKAESKPATRVVFAPAAEQCPPPGLGRGAASAASRAARFTEGDTVATAGHQRVNADMPEHIRQIAQRPRLRASGSAADGRVGRRRAGIVHIDDKTEVELLPEFTEKARASAAPTSPMTTSAA